PHSKCYGITKDPKTKNFMMVYRFTETVEDWCKSCTQQNFKNRTSGNHNIDELIQKSHLNAKSYEEIIEWIEYDRFENVEDLVSCGFRTIHKTTWKDGCWNSKNYRWENNMEVSLKCLHNSQDIIVEFLKKVVYFFYTF